MTIQNDNTSATTGDKGQNRSLFPPYWGLSQINVKIQILDGSTIRCKRDLSGDVRARKIAREGFLNIFIEKKMVFTMPLCLLIPLTLSLEYKDYFQRTFFS